jgi:hypothetical protein
MSFEKVFKLEMVHVQDSIKTLHLFSWRFDQRKQKKKNYNEKF